MSMTIYKKINNGTMTAEIKGRIDTTTSVVLENEMKECFDDCNNFVLDFSNVEYISSAGLRVLLTAHKIMCKKGGMKVKNVRQAIMEIFEVTGFSEILDIE